MMRWLSGLLFIPVAMAVPAAAQTPDTLKDLLRFQECPLSSQITAVYARPAFADPARQFTRISPKGKPEGYVRCSLRDRSVYCEASAVRGRSLSDRTPLPTDAVAALLRLGFQPQQGGADLMYRRVLTGSPDFDAVATLMLTTLHDAYGAREELGIETVAPFAGQIVTACVR
ncbi:TY-Chap domain-containing protein [Undibacter mobilis]|uniref:TY-Chap N-terminal domain-containing protein n=1 Tax=Undibacter mobilis TaxID=2292256 RepID=A0A371BBB1_9BRAD|nr:hypothetical protein [Undibacter mobilis]RDV04840.1 hypothetical protein DXH78_09860 [Undibacter mobilis]